MELEDLSEEQLQQVLEKVVQYGESNFRDFTPRINAAFESGRFTDFIKDAIPRLGDKGGDLLYALAIRDDDLCDQIDNMSREEAIYYLLNNATDIIDDIPLDSMTMDRFVKAQEDKGRRRREGTYGDEKERWFNKQNHEERTKLR